MEEAGCQNVQVLPLQGSYSAAIGRKLEHEILWRIYAALESSLIDGQVNVVRWRAPETDSCLGAPHILMLSSRLESAGSRMNGLWCKI